MRFVLALIFALGWAATAMAAGALPPVLGEISLVSHKAVYDLSLSRVAANEGIRAARGTMTYTLTDRCDGYTIESSIVMDLAQANGTDSQIDQRYAGWEAKDGRSATFRTQVFENGTLTRAYRGDVHLEEDGTGHATYESDAVRTFDLPRGTLLSTAHTAALMKNAAAGERFFSATVMDGSFEDGPFRVTAAISPMRDNQSAGNVAATSLDIRKAWPVDMAYFQLSTPRDTPDYEIATNITGGGITRSMTQDFGRFALGFQLVSVAPIAVSPCS